MEKLLKTEEDKNQFLWWIAFLKAGVFKQARGIAQIEGEEKYCILATLVVLFIPEEQIATAKTNACRPFDNTLWGLSANIGRLPKWANRLNDHFFHKTSFTSVMRLNDQMYFSLYEIADKLLDAYADELNEHN